MTADTVGKQTGQYQVFYFIPLTVTLLWLSEVAVVFATQLFSMVTYTETHTHTWMDA